MAAVGIPFLSAIAASEARVRGGCQGFYYDVKTGKLVEVPEAMKAGKA